MAHEPELPLHDIQGIVVPGFLKPQQALLYLTVPEGAPQRSRLCGELLDLLRRGALSSGRATLHDRRTFRRDRRCRGPRESRTREPLLALGVSATGLDKLSDGLHLRVPSPAFHAGIGARAGLLGDPDAATWDAAFGQLQPEALLVVAGDDQARVKAVAEELRSRLTFDDQQPHVEYGAAFDGGREHFGFIDGISQPGIRGRDGPGARAFVTRRHLPRTDPEHDLFGYPGQNLLWPGEFVLGWPGSGPDPRIPGPVRPVPDWMRNGSFLVYRRLTQDVAGLRRWLQQEADRLDGFPGFAGLSPAERAVKLGAKLVGRWPSGAPLARAPEVDDPALGRDPQRNNDFRFDDPTPVRTQRSPASPAMADSLGTVCPVNAHIRKVNVRDQASDIGGTAATQTRRILRVGVPFGPPLPPGCTDEALIGTPRGLLFLSIQASIEDQFEFLQARWINSGTLPRGPGGHDMLAGQNAPDGTRRCRLLAPDLTPSAEITSRQPFVTMTGGGYFFVPSLSALERLLSDGQV